MEQDIIFTAYTELICNVSTKPGYVPVSDQIICVWIYSMWRVMIRRTKTYWAVHRIAHCFYDRQSAWPKHILSYRVRPIWPYRYRYRYGHTDIQLTDTDTPFKNLYQTDTDIWFKNSYQTDTDNRYIPILSQYHTYI
jgi:hypothetical protein